MIDRTKVQNDYYPNTEICSIEYLRRRTVPQNGEKSAKTTYTFNNDKK